VSVGIEVRENASAALGKLQGMVDGARIHRVLAKAAAVLVKANFREKNREGNAQGWGRSNYWNDAAAATSQVSDGNTAKVVIDKAGVGLHFFGGTVVPVEAQYLTIPARAEAKGRRAGEIDGLTFIPNKNGGARLVDEAGSVWFWLVKSVTLQADPSVLPEEDEFDRAITDGLDDYFAALVAKGQK
jgi:hypothetical protein